MNTEMQEIAIYEPYEVAIKRWEPKSGGEGLLTGKQEIADRARAVATLQILENSKLQLTLAYCQGGCNATYGGPRVLPGQGGRGYLRNRYPEYGVDFERTEGDKVEMHFTANKIINVTCMLGTTEEIRRWIEAGRLEEMQKFLSEEIEKTNKSAEEGMSKMVDLPYVEPAPQNG